MLCPMRKFSSVFLFLLLACYPTWAAGPFGFEPGVTKDQIIALLGKSTIKMSQGDSYILSTAPKPHPDFEEYLLVISPSKGLLKVAAYSKDIETSTYGDRLKQTFEEIHAALTAKYGRSRKLDFLREGSIWNEEQDWMMGLLKEERVLSAYWTVGKDNVQVIALSARASSRSTGTIRLAYEFTGFTEWADAHKAKDASLF